MPTHPRHRGLYLVDCRQLSASVRFRRAGGRCERCGRPHGREVVAMHDGRWCDEDARLALRTERGSEPAHGRYIGFDGAVRHFSR